MYKAKIISNLKQHPAKWVNPFIALGGLLGDHDKDHSPFDDLKELVTEGLVEKDIVSLGNDKFNRPLQGELYRYTPPIGNNPAILALVK